MVKFLLEKAYSVRFTLNSREAMKVIEVKVMKGIMLKKDSGRIDRSLFKSPLE